MAMQLVIHPMNELMKGNIRSSITHSKKRSQETKTEFGTQMPKFKTLELLGRRFPQIFADKNTILFCFIVLVFLRAH